MATATAETLTDSFRLKNTVIKLSCLFVLGRFKSHWNLLSNSSLKMATATAAMAMTKTRWLDKMCVHMCVERRHTNPSVRASVG